jgi:hypothetical protein
MPATMLEAIAAALKADPTIAAIVEEENFYIPALGQVAPLSPTETPDAYEKALASGVPRLKPAVVLSGSSEQAAGAGGIHKQVFVRVTVVDRVGYANTEAVLDAAYAVLDGGNDDGQRFLLDDGSSVHTRFVDTPVKEGVDERVVTSGATRGAAMAFARYRVDMRWPA